ncbi:LOW QUALITY PROTEIN: olfactory receptor 6C2-like [Trichosurus vulpecula]|uniref:LOW QUALITY PROTEIN: olfactory receptor 6C2-like n=1 Tax=Trichosurus vulpecula TaxID=9337 RepID=UPI00186B1610|nr:LOW QUALITY PROTEIN: olfactory receptor 6C2-like [Trichosurus vulpecula]
MRNHTGIMLFILQGLTDDPWLKVLIFIFLFFTYILTIIGNLIIITLTLMDEQLKIPMYFFLQNFSFLEVAFTTAYIPRHLYSLSTGDNTITYNACVAQIFFVAVLGVTEFFLLTTMSYDCYVAICKPLHYTTIMNSKVCNQFLLSSWLAGLMTILPPLSLGFRMEFCDSNVIDHFGCEALPLIKIACSDTQLIEKIVLTFAVLTLIVTFFLVLLSYAHIIKTVLRISSAQQRKKAFSTCCSHIIVVSITYGSCIFIYIKPSAKGVALNKVVSVLTTSVTPVMNPLIYALRNKQVIQAFKDLAKKIFFLSK